MALFASNLAPASTDRALGAAKIQRSLRFNPSDRTYLDKTFSSAGNRTTFTFSFWIKRTTVGRNTFIFSPQIGGDGANESRLYITDGDQLRVYDSGGSSGYIVARAAALLRDVSSWYHCVVAVDTTQSTDSDRAKFYINGVQQDIDTSGFHQWGNQNQQLGWGNNNRHRLGSDGYQESFSDSMIIADYLAEVHYVNGSQLDASYFGFTDPQTGIWMPKRYEGTHGTNGFYLDFSDNSSTTTLGIDKSPNRNDFTANNFSVAAGEGNDSLEDTPTNNFCTMNPLVPSPLVTWANGNLDLAGSSSTEYSQNNTSTFGVSSGKWYVEVKYTNDGTTNTYVGICPISSSATTNMTGSVTDAAVIRMDNTLFIEGSAPSSGTSISSGDIIGIALDMDNQKVWFSVQNTYVLSGNPSTGANATFDGITAGETMSIAARPLNGTLNFNFGQRPFAYTPPTGFKTLESRNLPLTTPSIIRPQRHFDTILYTGNGSTGQSITSLEFQPDLIWFKSRSHARNHVMTDSVRGRSKGVYPDDTSAEFTDDSNKGLVSFDPNGFTVGEPQNASSHNNNGESIVAWCWKAGGTAVTNNDGNNTSQVSANTEAGFSILTYTGNGTNNSNVTMGHGLGKTPGCVIIKNRSSSKEFVTWITGTGGSATDNQKNLQLNATATAGQNSDQFRYADSSIIAVRSTDSTNGKVNKNGDNYVAYVWADIPGYSKFGSYEGNGSTDGTYVHLGFRPAWVMWKNASASTVWIIFDAVRETYNFFDAQLRPNENSAENVAGASYSMDFLSNGFKLRSSDSNFNGNGNTIVYMAFAEQPGTTPFNTFPNAR